jgi:hypothetical protein
MILIGKNLYVIRAPFNIVWWMGPDNFVAKSIAIEVKLYAVINAKRIVWVCANQFDGNKEEVVISCRNGRSKRLSLYESPVGARFSEAVSFETVSTICLYVFTSPVVGIRPCVRVGVGVSTTKVGSGFAAPAVANGILVAVADGAGLVIVGVVSCPPLVKLGKGTLQARMASTIARLAIKDDLLFFFFIIFLLGNIMRSY